MDDFRRFFLRGLAVLVPTLVTFALVVWAYKFVNENVGVYITRGLMELCSQIREVPAEVFVNRAIDPLKYGTPINEWDEETGRRLTIEYKAIHHKALQNNNPGLSKEAIQAHNRALWRIAFRKYKLHLLGFGIAIILVYFTGFFLASFLGRTSWRAAESLLQRIPVIRAIYSNVKQVTDFLLSERPLEYSGVVAVQYPRKGVWSLGLTTGKAMERVQEETSDQLITVFIPSSPTPITGYVVQVPRKEVIVLNMSIDEGLRFTISGGVIKPGAILPDIPTPQQKG